MTTASGAWGFVIKQASWLGTACGQPNNGTLITAPIAGANGMRKLGTGKPRIQLARTQGSHLPLGQAGADRVSLKSAPAPGLSLRADGNTVDLDRSMGDLAENTIKYKTSAQLIAIKLKGLKNAIIGGR